MGNKRKLLKYIEEIIKELPHKTIAEGFSGSGIVSRLFKIYANELYVNDIAGYSKTLNECYLSTPSQHEIEEIKKYINKANEYVELNNDNIPSWIRKHWSPKLENIEENERVYFTPQNAQRIDYYRNFILSIPKKYQSFLLAPLLVESSIHNNTNGQFSGFYKKNGKGAYGGKTGTDYKRITKNIKLPYPIFNENKCKIQISQQDTNKWIETLPEVDIVYYDPPYNKHPYSIYYFLLDIINDWDLNQEIPNTYRGQPKNWIKSDYNSKKYAEKAFEDLISKTKAKYIIVSYNNGGIISSNKMEDILKKYGTLTIHKINHKIYNRMIGIASYKKTIEKEKIKEFLYVLKTIS